MIYQLKIALQGAKPPIWRRVQVDPRITFAQLHHIIQIAMEWDDSHLHLFQFRQHTVRGRGPFSETAYIGDPAMELGMEPFFDEREETVADWLAEKKDECQYIYDFGDEWRHIITLEKVIQPDAEVTYPVCVKARRPAPEEDSGGIFVEDGAEKTDEEIMEAVNVGFRARIEDLTPVHADFPPDDSPRPTPEQWRELVERAVEFKKLKSWEWMSDDQIFAVQDAHSGRTAYCSVMGQLGEVFGMAVYVDEEGLESLLRLMEEEGENDQQLYEQNSLLVAFENRQDLEEEDYRILKELGLRFRGKKEWPQFRSYRPGCFPWVLDADEAAFLSRVLQQAVEVCRRVEKNPQLLETDDELQIFARVSAIRGETITWTDGIIDLSLQPLPGSEPVQYVDEVTLRGLKKACPVQPVELEYRYFYLPDAVQEGSGRPYFPCVAMWMDRETQQILGFHMGKRDELAPAIQTHFTRWIEKYGWIPRTIRVNQEEVHLALFPLAEALPFQLEFVDDLPVMQDVETEFIQMMGQGLV